jgi:DNA-binding response OmpR family regulator
MTDPSSVVLLVEGDICVRHPLAEYLRGCGFKVLEASNGDEARVTLSAPDYQIDVVLAEMTTAGSGFALSQWVRANHPGVEIILAGSVEKATERAGALCNEGPALAKPYAHHLVLDQIRRSLGRRKPTRRGQTPSLHCVS